MSVQIRPPAPGKKKGLLLEVFYFGHCWEEARKEKKVVSDTYRKANLAEHFLDVLPFPSIYHLSINIPLDLFNPSFPANPATIGDVIRKLRIEQGLYQKELAEGIGVDEMTIVNWEKSRTRPGGKHMKSLGEYFSLNLDELMKGGTQR